MVVVVPSLDDSWNASLHFTPPISFPMEVGTKIPGRDHAVQAIHNASLYSLRHIPLPYLPVAEAAAVAAAAVVTVRSVMDVDIRTLRITETTAAARTLVILSPIVNAVRPLHPSCSIFQEMASS